MAYTLTAKSQVTLPKPIRDHLKVAPGDAVEFRIKADGSVQVEPVRAASAGAQEPSPQSLAKYRSLIGMNRTGMSTDEWMNLLRGYDEDANDPGFAPLPVPPGTR
jgi:AbrB family looped-hinge helix DNA binding protein